jgi:thiol-disulfide isomerase/thioredoxin
MKKTILLSILMAGVSFAGFEKWTNKDGKAAELELVKVTEASGVKTGEFKMRNGKTISLKATDLAEADAKRLDEWKPSEGADAAAATEAKPSVFDEVLDGDLVKLDGKSVKRHELATKPKKYYIFYYTASWCGPCQQYTPSLVEFYNKNKNENFELVVITWDKDEDAMEGYAKEKKMPWPLLKLAKADKFQKKFNHGVTGIPSVITCSLDGEIVSKTESTAELEKLVK